MTNLSPGLYYDNYALSSTVHIYFVAPVGAGYSESVLIVSMPVFTSLHDCLQFKVYIISLHDITFLC